MRVETLCQCIQEKTRSKYVTKAYGWKEVVNVLDGGQRVIWSDTPSKLRQWLRLLATPTLTLCTVIRSNEARCMRPKGEGPAPRNEDYRLRALQFFREVEDNMN